ncbi:hypothetical protein AAFF_G00002160 [Aldrovandia affinis]|uniref:Uncharacterized protein n=1 Tax=Aldrovandia affinis TaxID=143900 RepID=A0AAD7TDN5_9TELE|nr:hypothetical protein AAFF_G00002160 [Aldrovandia affinis]
MVGLLDSLYQIGEENLLDSTLYLYGCQDPPVSGEGMECRKKYALIQGSNSKEMVEDKLCVFSLSVENNKKRILEETKKATNRKKESPQPSADITA